MGSGIVTLLLQKGHPVILKEVAQKYLDAAMKRIKSNLGRWLKKRKRPASDLEKLLANLTPQLDYSGFDRVDCVIEAVLERVDLKQKIFTDLVRICRPDCVLGTNTSTIDINKIAGHTGAIDRVVGLHFFSPAHIMPLLEVIRTEKSDPQILADMLAFSKSLGKIPVLVGNCVGFTANRMVGSPMLQAAAFLAERGADPYTIDRAVEAYNLPMGPFRLADLSGLDIWRNVLRLTYDEYPNFVYRTDLFEKMCADGKLGQKSGEGFYRYEGRKSKQNPALALRRPVAGPSLSALPAKDLAEMCLFPVINESFRILDEGHCSKASDIDIVAAFGYSWPRTIGGPQNWANQQLGVKYVRDRLAKFASIAPAGKNLFTPCPALEEAARK